ncbi:BrnT family toxin [Bauldia litoralis]|uniref:BrnT family toxin n=1 Tax=Bauldia litoralis TaxID=665467 RepID=UPI000B85BE24|nr:BrnT family toxin [Bauldia litoralis]
MRVSFDPDKHERNLRERGFGFDYAALIFEGRTLEWPDRRRNYGEARIIAIGTVADDVMVVVYTDRDDTRRIISARLANTKERKLWRQSR